MEFQRLTLFVHHRQSDAAQLRFLQQLSILLPAMQRRQRIEFALDRPIGADHRVGAAHQPDAHHPLQEVGAMQAVRHVQALLNELPAQSPFFL